jgi:hypothetical protein
MEPEGSLPCSKQPSAGHYPEPDESNPHRPDLFPQDPFFNIYIILILSSHVRLGIPSGLFPSGFPTKILYAFLISPCALHARPSHLPSFDH